MIAGKASKRDLSVISVGHHRGSLLFYSIKSESIEMSKRISSLMFIAILVLVLAGCGGGDQSALPNGGLSSNNGTDSTGGNGNVAGILMWDAPSPNNDGSLATNLAGYKIYYGTVPNKYTASIDVGDATSIPVTTLSSSVPVPGLYYITVTAYDTVGNESGCSNEITISL